MCGESECMRALNFIELNRQNKYSRTMLSFYLSGVRQAKDLDAMRKVLEFYRPVTSEDTGDRVSNELMPLEARLVGRQAAFLALELKANICNALEDSQCGNTSYAVISRFLQTGKATCAGFSTLNQKILGISGYAHHDKRDVTTVFFCLLYTSPSPRD